MQKHWFKVTSTEGGGMLLLTTVRDVNSVCVAIYSDFCSINRRQCHRSVL